MNDATFPTDEQLDKLFEGLLPPNDEMDHASASIVLERQGVNRAWLANELKTRLQRRVEEIQKQGKDVPSELLKMIASL